MIRSIKTLAFFASALLFFVACEKEDSDAVNLQDEPLTFLLTADTDETVDALVFESDEAISDARQAFSGETNHRFSGDCFSLIYPVTVDFSDGTSETVADEDALKLAVRTWISNNGTRPNRATRPRLSLPFDVLLADGTIETIETRVGLRAVIANCRPDARPCFTLVYPISVDFNGTVESFDNAEDMRNGIRDYRIANPTAPRSTLVFPISIESDRFAITQVNSLMELRRLQLACRTDRDNGNHNPCFNFDYPLNFSTPAGRVVVVTNAVELRRALSHAGRDGRLSLEYPFTVTMADGTTREINEVADFRQLRQDCN